MGPWQEHNHGALQAVGIAIVGGCQCARCVQPCMAPTSISAGALAVTECTSLTAPCSRIAAFCRPVAADSDMWQVTLQAITGMRTVPQVFVGGKLVGGCDGELMVPLASRHMPARGIKACMGEREGGEQRTVHAPDAALLA